MDQFLIKVSYEKGNGVKDLLLSGPITCEAEYARSKRLVVDGVMLTVYCATRTTLT